MFIGFTIYFYKFFFSVKNSYPKIQKKELAYIEKNSKANHEFIFVKN